MYHFYSIPLFLIKQKRERIMSLTVDICGKRTLEYVTDCLGKFNRKTDEVIIRAFGGNITKGVRVAQILANEFNNLIMWYIEI